jgi:3-hydroxyisobutyrate dehydrogenase-like beta-hydroxyacid dehydrogenase
MTVNEQAHVGVVGTGLMGAAVARCLISAGHEVHVWNRTAGRCWPLTQIGAHAHASVQGLANASDILFMTVTDYPAAEALLNGLDLNGTLVICLCTGALGEAERLAELVFANGGSYLETTILNYPEDVGTERGVLATSGDVAAHERVLFVLRDLGQVRYAGDTFSAANVLALCYGAYLSISIIGGLQAAALFEVCGGDPKVLFDIADEIRGNIRGPLSRIPTREERALPAPPAVSANVATHLEGVKLELETARKVGVQMSLLEAVWEQMEEFANTDHRGSDLEQCFRLLAPVSNMGVLSHVGGHDAR